MRHNNIVNYASWAYFRELRCNWFDKFHSLSQFTDGELVNITANDECTRKSIATCFSLGGGGELNLLPRVSNDVIRDYYIQL